MKFRVIATVFVLYSSLAVAGEELTYIDIINRLTDLEHLAILPAVGEKCAQWSSYDRASRYDRASGRYIGWSANKDGSGIIRQENDELVLAQMQGPGIIWRIWSARPEQGHVKIYLDDNNEPAVDLPFEGYFNGENEPFTRPALVHETAKGQNCYIPIGYQKSCKITAQHNWGAYYHFTYTTYPKTTILPTFKRNLSPDQSAALDRANKILTHCGISPADKTGDRITEKKTITIAPGKTETVAQLNGKRAITAIKVYLDLPEHPDDYDVLGELALSIHWDGEPVPAVWSPLGDFFGTAVGLNKYKSLPMGMTKNGFYCYWYMPFEKSALIELANNGDKERTVTFTIAHSPVTKPIAKLGRFHAKWHRDAFLPQQPERRKIDWTMLKTQGRGRYCGVMLHVWNPKGGWWGEGDEKFFVDGERFPSTFGTGSEDYFGYAWCNPTLFSNCYHNQTISMGNRGHISVNRWHITDNVPFQKSFEAVIEKYYPNSRPTLYAAISYWYQAAGEADPYEPVPVAKRIGYWRPIQLFKARDVLEGEDIKVLAKTAGNLMRQDLNMLGAGWSAGAHLWWIDARPGDTLDLSVPVQKTGVYELKMQLTKAIDYGIVQLYLDGNKLGGPIDLYNDRVVPSGLLDMGRYRLDNGQHKFRIEIVGANPNAVKRYMFGLDYIKLRKVD